MAKRLLYTQTPPKLTWIKPLHGTITNANANPGASGRVFLSACDVPYVCKADNIVSQQGVTTTGNARVGLYGPLTSRDSLQAAPLIYDSGDIALGSAYQTIDSNMPDTVLLPGQYAIAISYSDVLTNYYKYVDSVETGASDSGYFDQAYGALPATVPAVTTTGNGIPIASLRVIPV